MNILIRKHQSKVKSENRIIDKSFEKGIPVEEFFEHQIVIKRINRCKFIGSYLKEIGENRYQIFTGVNFYKNEDILWFPSFDKNPVI